MKTISREDFGYYEAPIDLDELEKQREDREYHDELESEEKRLRESEQWLKSQQT